MIRTDPTDSSPRLLLFARDLLVGNRVSAKVSKFLSLEQFTARIKPWVLSGYHDHIVKKTFLLGSIKFSAEKYSNIDISETSQKLKPLLKYGAEKFDDSNRPNLECDLAEDMGRAWFFEELTLMKSLYSAGELKTAKICSGKWREDYDSRDEEYQSQFIDEEHYALKQKMLKTALMKQQNGHPDAESIRQRIPGFGSNGFSAETAFLPIILLSNLKWLFGQKCFFS